MFYELWNNNSLAVVEVGIVSGSYIRPSNLDEIVDFLENQKNIKINFNLDASHTKPQYLAVDTEGNFSTVCKNISYDEEISNKLDDLMDRILPFSPFITGEATILKQIKSYLSAFNWKVFHCSQ